MLDFLEKNKCNGCYACVSKCPKNCIEMVSDAEGFWYPNIDKKICISCGLCEKVCPIKVNNLIEDKPLGCFAAFNNDVEVQKNSSSGGIFSLIAKEVLSEGGIVFGAAFTEDFKAVEHIAIESVEDLSLLMGSKYLQSKIGDTYSQAKQYLDLGRKVLFSGTPCQIGGLYAYLGKEYENLLTQDIVCHGVPSPKVWEKYVAYREAKALSKLQKVFLRYKQHGWKEYSVKFDFENGIYYKQIFLKDLFMRGFLADIYLRPSCYDCCFKAKKHLSDITLADFWGIENIDSSMYNRNGTSLVIVNTEKGQEIFSKIDGLTQKNEDLNKAIKYNPALIKSAKLNANRDLFFKDINKYEFNKLINKYVKTSFKNKVKKIIKKILVIFKLR